MADKQDKPSNTAAGQDGPARKGQTAARAKAVGAAALARASEQRDKATGWLLLAPGEANQAVGRMSGRTMMWLAIVLGAIVLLSMNVIVSTAFKGTSTDLTENKLYTISDGTRRVLGNLEEPIDVKVYYSSRLGEASSIYKRYFERVRALLQRYATMADGKLNVSFIDPEPFSTAEDRAVSAGLQGVQLNAEGDKGYLGLVATNSTDQTETIPFFSPQREPFLEYDLTKLIYKLAVPKKIVVGLMSALQINGGFNMQARQKIPAWQIVDQIKEFFDVQQIAQNATEIPTDVQVLMLVHPNGMTPEAALAVDQFALGGGRVLVFVDPVSELSKVNARAGAPVSTNNAELTRLLKAWGVAFDPTKVVGDIESARRVQLGGPQPMITEFVVWLALRETPNIDSKDVVSDGVKTINIVTPGALSPIKGAKTNFQPILKTSTSAMEIDAVRLMGPQPDPVALLRNYKPGGKALVLAARVTGEIKTAFPDGLPKEKNAADEQKADAKAGTGKSDDDKSTDGAARKRAEDDAAKTGAAQDDPKGNAGSKRRTTGKLNAIVVADSDFLYDQFWVDRRQVFGRELLVPTAHNAVFVVNAIENLSGGEALSGLRGRGVDDRPFVTIETIRRNAEKEFREREKALSAKLESLRKQLSQVEQRSGGSTGVGVSLSDQDKAAIEKFKRELIATRQQLRNVKHAMRADIDRLEARVKFINIAAVPLLIGLFALFAMWRRNHRSAA